MSAPSSGPPRPPLAMPPHEPYPVPADAPLRLAEMGIADTADTCARLADYLGRLLAMNQRMNLVSRVDPANAWDRHVADSLTLVPLLAGVASGGRLLDVGSGGGLPGVPIAIARPDIRVTLLDATKKKTRFLSELAGAMALENLDVVNGRAEALAKGELGRSFDVVTARAVSRLATLVTVTAPFAKPGGRLLLIKGQRAEEELTEARQALRKLRLSRVDVVPTPTGRIVVLRRGD